MPISDILVVLSINRDGSATSMQVFTAKEMQAFEQQLVSPTLSLHDLMCRAGQALLDTALDRYADATTWVVLCGTGNNAGDGYYLARKAKKVGIQVTCVSMGDRLPQPAAIERELAQQCSVPIIDAADMGELLDHCDLIIDALLGIGFQGGQLKPAYANVIRSANASDAPIISADVPSGLDATSGGSGAIVANITCSFIAAKRGTLTGAALDYVGELLVFDLGVAADSQSTSTLLVTHSDCAPMPKRGANEHKGTRGSVLLLGGNERMGGAIMLASESALAMGAGRVYGVTHESHIQAALTRSPEIMYRSSIKDLPKVDVMAVGPGMARGGEWARQLWQALDYQVVVDADGLYWLKQYPREVAVITPHPGEAAYLLDTTVDVIEADRFAAVKQLADRYRCVAILKGAGTLVANHLDDQIVLVRAGNAVLSVGGTGDILCGAVAALIAQGYDTIEASVGAVLVHGVAADRYADERGEHGLRASNLIDYMVAVINDR